MDELRKPFLIAALVLIALAVAVEAGLGAYVASHVGGANQLDRPTPGYGISYLACIDVLLLYSLVLMTLSMFVSRELTGRLQGIVGLVASLLGLLALIVMVFFAIQLLILMVSLLLAPIFGTLAYLAAFGSFSRGTASATLSFVMLLKIAFGVCLVIAQPRFLENKSLVLLGGLSFGCTLLVGFLHSFPPGILASITDIIGAIIIAIVAIIWVILLLFGSIVAVVKAVV
jgi:hypothetical protein